MSDSTAQAHVRVQTDHAGETWEATVDLTTDSVTVVCDGLYVGGGPVDVALLKTGRIRIVSAGKRVPPELVPALETLLNGEWDRLRAAGVAPDCP